MIFSEATALPTLYHYYYVYPGPAQCVPKFPIRERQHLGGLFWQSEPADASMRCRKPAISLRRVPRSSCYQSHRPYFYTAPRSAASLFRATGSSAMSVSSQPSALTFELKARCSVSLLVSGSLLELTNSADHQSSSVYPPSSSRTRRAAHIHARGHASFPQRPHR